MATMKDVARAAGVSVATVSHVINSTRFVSAELAARVNAAMTDLGYTPDGTARSLRVRRTNTIGLVVPDNSNPFFAELARLIEEDGFRAGYTTILGNSTEQPARERQYVETLLSKRVDGLILAPTRHDNGGLQRLVRAARIPIVFVDRDVDVPGVDKVLYDTESGGYAAGRHLLDLGHERIACIAGPSELSSVRARVTGLRRALEEAGKELRAHWLVESDLQYAGGRDATAQLLAADEGFTAIFAANDLMAVGAIRELTARGIRVPEDVSVVGFDDAPLAVMVSPTLTTVRQPLHEMAATAVSLLLARLQDRDRPLARRVIPTELLVRESTTAAPERGARAKEVGDRAA